MQNAAYTENTTDEGGERFDIRLDIDGEIFVDVDPSIYDETDGTSVASVIANIIKNRFNNIIKANRQQIQQMMNGECQNPQDTCKK